MISNESSDTIYKHLLAKHYGDHVAAIMAHDDVMRYLKLYARDISEVPERKATPKYCVTDVCFDTVSRKRQFKSLYSGVYRVLEVGEELPEPKYEARYVRFDILFCCEYYGEVRYSRLHLKNRIRVPEVGMGFYVFGEDLDSWAKRVTKDYWEAESDRDCRARNYSLDACLCDIDDMDSVYTGRIDNAGFGNFSKIGGFDMSGFVDGVRILKAYSIKEE